MTLFCSDIDGTLLNASRTVSERTASAIEGVRAAGHEFVLCSSRMVESMRVLQGRYGAAGTALIAYNGGLVLDGDGVVLADVAIDSGAARAVYDLCLAHDVHGSFFVGDSWYPWGDDRWSRRETENTWVMPSNVTAAGYIGRVDEAPPHKIMCMGDPAGIDAIEHALRDDPRLATYRSKDTYLEIGSSRCDKGTGLAVLAAHLGADDTVFFGDNYNDLPAFAVAGTSVAVANAKPEVLAAADVVTERHHNDGVAAYLERWLEARA